MRIKLPKRTHHKWAADSSVCFVCGKIVKPEPDGTFLYMIEVSTKGEWITGEGNAPDSQGGFPVGGRCYRRILIPLAQSAQMQVNSQLG